VIILALVAGLVAGVLPLASAGVAEAAVPSPPTLTSPASGASSSANPILAWSPVTGAAKYEVGLSSAADFSPLLGGYPVTTQELRFAPPTELPPGEIYWRVVALDASGGRSDPAVGSFTKGWGDAPVVVAPADGKAFAFPTEPVLFSWGAVPGAASYELQIDDADDFIGTKSYATRNTDYVLTEPVTVNQTFYWRVRGVSGSLTSAWSPTSRFTSAWSSAPVLKVPAADATGVTDVYFDWDPVLGAKTYQLQVSPNQDWTNNTTIDITVKSTRYAPPDPLNNGNYYWRVRAMDAGSPANYGPWSDTRVFLRGWSDTPTILWPQDGTSTSEPNPDDPTWQNPTFSWTPAKRASWYRIRFATSPTMTASKDPVTGKEEKVWGCITNRTTFSLYAKHEGKDLSAGSCDLKFVVGDTYYWDVAAIDNPVQGKSAGLDVWGPPKQETSVVGLRSAVQSFSYDSPQPPAGELRQLAATDYLTPTACDPAAGCTVAEKDTPTFTWSAVPASCKVGDPCYIVTVALDPNFTNVYRVYHAFTNRLTPRDSWRDNQANQAYYWNVTPVGLSLDKTSYSVFQKRTEGVHRTLPAGGSSQPDDFTFEWQDYLDTNQALQPAAVEAAKSYRIKVSAVSDFATLLDEKVVNTPFYTPYDRTYPEGPIYWRVQAIDGSGNELTVSNGDNGSVTKASPPPSPRYPGNATTVKGVPYLQWDALAYAASYDVQLDDDPSFSSPIKTASTKMAAWAHVDPLAAGTYYWRVRRRDADNREGAWSATRSFTLQPAAVTLISPVNDSTPAGTTLLLQWKATQPSPKYRVEVSTSASFTTQVSGFPQDTVMSAVAPKTLFANGTYYWRVKSLNASNTVVATSSTWSFMVDATYPSVVGLSPSSGAPIDSAFTVTFSEPVTDVDASSLTVTATGASSALDGTVSIVSPTVARFTPKAALVPGQTYTVRVSAAVKDRSGLPLAAYSASVRTSTTVQEDSAAVQRAWPRWNTSAASGGALKLSQRAGSTLTYTFTGTSIGLLGYIGKTGGYAAVTLDGVAQGNVSFYAKTAAYKATVWSKTDLTAGKHVLQVKALGTKPSGSSGKLVYVDGFTVDGATVEETASGVVDSFSRVATTKASGSAYDLMDFAKASGRVTPTLTLTFKGTGISWVGTKTKTSGKAVVYIDNVKKKTIDLYSSKTAYKKTLWTSAKLSDGVHSIKVVISGSKRGSAKGYDVSFDAFSIK
jgi:translation initiation factor 1 (eIF-1/SUI1)